MGRNMRSVLCVLSVCLLFFALCLPAYAQEAEVSETPPPTPQQETQTSNEEEKSGGGCNTAEELHAFLSAKSGGSVTLTGDIVWDSGVGLDPIVNISSAAVVEMGEYKITVPAGYSMHIEGPVTFRGQGAAVFEVEGSLNLSYGAQILSSGTEAVALHIGGTGSVSLTYCRIAATGENATAIRSALPVQTGAVTIQLCDISGTAASIQAPSVTLDATTASPMPEGATVIDRVPVIDRSMRLYGISLSSGTDQEQYREAIYGLNLWNFAFIDPASGNTIGLYLPSTWSNVPEHPAAAGCYTLTLEASSLPEWFPVEIPAFDIPLHIVDNSRPHITVMFGDASFGFVSLMLTNGERFADAQQITLYYSTDGGTSWRDVSEDFSGAIVDMMMLSAEPLTPETNYLFYAKITRGAEKLKSNILYYPNFASDLDVDFSYGGGDPDEDDFGDQGEEAPSGTIIPPPKDAPGSQDASPPPSVSKVKGATESMPVSEVKGTAESTSVPKVQGTAESTAVSEVKGTAESTPVSEVKSTAEPLSASGPQPQETPALAKVPVFLCLLAVTGAAAAVCLWRRKGGRR